MEIRPPIAHTSKGDATTCSSVRLARELPEGGVGSAGGHGGEQAACRPPDADGILIICATGASSLVEVLGGVNARLGAAKTPDYRIPVVGTPPTQDGKADKAALRGRVDDG